MELSPASLPAESHLVEANSDSPPHEQNSEILLSVNLPQFPPPEEVMVANRRLWAFWPANNRFCLDGRVMIGPRSDLPKTLTSTLLLVFLPCCYFVFVMPYVWSQVTQVLPALNVFLFLTTIALMMLSMLVEPGIIPRKCVFELNGPVPEQFTVSVITKDQVNGPKYKYCKTCQIFRPPKANHCKMCGNCVEVFDHHCPFLNNCVGKRNYKYFLFFVMSTVLMGLAMVTGLFLFFFYDHSQDKSDDNVIPESKAVITVVVILLVLTLVLTLLVSILCCFHISVCWSGDTTKEKLKKLEHLKTDHRWWLPYYSWFDRRQILTVQQADRATQWRDTQVRE